MGKLIIFSAPSGSGKSTIINYLLTQELNLAFSISATSRPPRGTEQNGVEYFFLSPDEFRSRIANDEFLEYEEVYQDSGSALTGGYPYRGAGSHTGDGGNCADRCGFGSR